MRLERDEHHVLRAQFGGIVGGGDPDGEILGGRDQPQAILADCREMGAAGDQADLDTFYAREVCADDSADRAGAIEADLHGNSSQRGSLT